MTGSYVAMGSSFGAGPGLQPRDRSGPRFSGRSTRNYAHLFASFAGLDLSDVTYSGETIRQLLHGTRHARPPQVDAVHADTSLVTITGGGNDIGYLPGLTLASVPLPVGLLLGGRRRLRGFTDAARVDDRFRHLESDLGALLERIRERAPRARIVIVDYLTILPPASLSAPPLSDEVAAWGRGVAARLSDTLARAAADADADFVPVGAASRDHHAWAAAPWTRRFHYSLRGGAPYHPTLDGMQHVARMLADQLSPIDPTGGPVDA
jgi:lysophospholipase L1-like esterase